MENVNKVMSDIVCDLFNGVCMDVQSAVNSGFNVALISNMPEAELLFIDFFYRLSNKEENGGFDKKVFVIKDRKELSEYICGQGVESAKLSKALTANSLLKTKEFDIYRENFIIVELPNIKDLANSMKAIVARFLKYHGQYELFSNVFDGLVLMKLVNILERGGFKALEFAIHHYAYYAGFMGNECKGNRMLFECMSQVEDRERVYKRSSSSKSFAKSYLKGVSKQKDPFLYVKCSMTYYLIKKRGYSLSKAAKLLCASRTTVTQYLKDAHILEVWKELKK